jgi:hypothetical protein
VARPRAADDFKIIRQRMEELRLERDRALTRQNLGPPANGVCVTTTIARTTPGGCVPLFFGSSSAEALDQIRPPRTPGLRHAAGAAATVEIGATARCGLASYARPLMSEPLRRIESPQIAIASGSSGTPGIP